MNEKSEKTKNNLDDFVRVAAAQSGLSENACRELLGKGWVLTFEWGQPTRWVQGTLDAITHKSK